MAVLPVIRRRAGLQRSWSGSLALKPSESLASSLTLTIGLLAEAGELDASWACETEPDASQSQACEAEHMCCNEEPRAPDAAFIGRVEASEPDASKACEAEHACPIVSWTMEVDWAAALPGTLPVIGSVPRRRLNSRMWGSLRWIS